MSGNDLKKHWATGLNHYKATDLKVFLPLQLLELYLLERPDLELHILTNNPKSMKKEKGVRKKESAAPGRKRTHGLTSLAPVAFALPLCYSRCSTTVFNEDRAV